MAFWHRAHSVECFFSTSYSRISPCFTAGQRIGVWNCHATFRHRKTTIFTPIVYEEYQVLRSTSCLCPIKAPFLWSLRPTGDTLIFIFFVMYGICFSADCCEFQTADANKSFFLFFFCAARTPATLTQFPLSCEARWGDSCKPMP